MAFYGAVAGCTLEKKYDHENTGTMNLIRNFLPFLLFIKSEKNNQILDRRIIYLLQKKSAMLVTNVKDKYVDDKYVIKG